MTTLTFNHFVKSSDRYTRFQLTYVCMYRVDKMKIHIWVVITHVFNVTFIHVLTGNNSQGKYESYVFLCSHLTRVRMSLFFYPLDVLLKELGQSLNSNVLLVYL